jgi:hypothetical protein
MDPLDHNRLTTLEHIHDTIKRVRTQRDAGHIPPEKADAIIKQLLAFAAQHKAQIQELQNKRKTP